MGLVHASIKLGTAKNRREVDGMHDSFFMGDLCLVVGSAFLSTAVLRVFLAP